MGFMGFMTFKLNGWNWSKSDWSNLAQDENSDIGLKLWRYPKANPGDERTDFEGTFRIGLKTDFGHFIVSSWAKFD